MRADTIQRLIQLKDEELNGLRLDVARLDQLVNDAQNRHKHTLHDYEQFMEQIRASASDNRTLAAHDLIAHRGFLAHLHQQSKSTEQILLEVTKQRDFAQQALEQLYIEKKSFELIDERKRTIKQHEQNRHQFMMADDEELLRTERGRQAHAEY